MNLPPTSVIGVKAERGCDTLIKGFDIGLSDSVCLLFIYIRHRYITKKCDISPHLFSYFTNKLNYSEREMYIDFISVIDRDSTQRELFATKVLFPASW